MTYKFKRLADVEQADSDNNGLLLSEVNGAIKKTTINIKNIAIKGTREDDSDDLYELICIGATYNEADEILTNGGILKGNVFEYNTIDSLIVSCSPIIEITKRSHNTIVIRYYKDATFSRNTLYWTEDGVYNYDPREA